MTDVLEQIIALVSATTNVEAAKITGDTDLDSLGFDSLTVTEMAVVIERKFSISVEEDELARCLTVGEIADIVAGQAEHA